MIEEGRWVVMSRDLRVHLTIRPRRSEMGEQTRVSLRAEPMPLREYLPEQLEQDGHAMAWVWNGTAEHAQSIVSRILDLLQIHLQPSVHTSPTGVKWRAAVLASLFPGPVAVTSADQSRRA